MSPTRSLPADVYPETLSRLRPVRREQLDPTQQKLYDALNAPRSGRLNLAGIKGPGGVDLRMPRLIAHRGDINRMLRVEIGLDDALVELAILAAAREISSPFVWAMHEPVAREVGVADTTIEVIRHGGPLAGLPEEQAALIALARESIGARKVSPATYARALALFGEEDLLHYSLLMANYVQHAILLTVVGQELHDHQSPGLPELQVAGRSSYHRPAQNGGGAMIKGLHHNAYRCRDAEQTRRFYEDFLGLKLSNAFEIGETKTGRRTQAIHIFFGMDDGSSLAFFEVPGMPFEFKTQHDFDLHIALEVEYPELERMLAEGKRRGIETRGISDHGFIHSIYFRDPNGYVIELTAKVPGREPADGSAARSTLDRWQVQKLQAGAPG